MVCVTECKIKICILSLATTDCKGTDPIHPISMDTIAMQQNDAERRPNQDPSQLIKAHQRYEVHGVYALWHRLGDNRT